MARLDKSIFPASVQDFVNLTKSEILEKLAEAFTANKNLEKLLGDTVDELAKCRDNLTNLQTDFEELKSEHDKISNDYNQYVNKARIDIETLENSKESLEKQISCLTDTINSKVKIINDQYNTIDNLNNKLKDRDVNTWIWVVLALIFLALACFAWF